MCYALNGSDNNAEYLCCVKKSINQKMAQMETKKIGNKIFEARKRTNISQAELGKRLFISPQAVGKWERGESMPDIITLNRLAEILGVDLNYFSDNFKSVAIEIPSTESLVKQSTELPSGKPEKMLTWHMSQGNWVGADFSGLKNLHEKFSFSNMLRCKFIGSDLSGLLLKNNNVESCDFSGTNLKSSQIQKSILTKDQFKESSLKETGFSESYIYGCDFSGTDFTGVVVKSCDFRKNSIDAVVWNRTSFIDTQIADIVFTGTIEECYFENCAVSRVTFRNATLINTFFKNNKKMKRIRFIDCKADRMTYEFLKQGNADLTGITLLSPKKETE